MVGGLFFTRAGYILISALGLEPDANGHRELNESEKKKDLFGVVALCCLWVLFFGGLCLYFLFGPNASPGWFWLFFGVAIVPIFHFLLYAVVSRRNTEDPSTNDP